MIKKKLTTLILVLCVIALTGCENNKTPEQMQQDLDDRYECYIKSVNYRGHSYIIYSDYRKGGIVHDPDCPCRENGGNDD